MTTKKQSIGRTRVKKRHAPLSIFSIQKIQLCNSYIFSKSGAMKKIRECQRCVSTVMSVSIHFIFHGSMEEAGVSG